MEKMVEVDLVDGWTKTAHAQSHQPYPQDSWEHLFTSAAELFGINIADEAEESSSDQRSSQGDDRALPERGANQRRQLAPQAVQASHAQDGPPTPLEDFTASRNVVVSSAYTLTVSQPSCPGVPSWNPLESNDFCSHPLLLDPHEDGDANMLVASGASPPSPFDHARPRHAPSDGPLSPVPPAAADMEGAASTTLPATPDAPAAPAPPAVASAEAGDGALPAPDLNPSATAADSLPVLDAPISLAQPLDMGLAMDVPMPMSMPMDMNMNTNMSMHGLGMAPDFAPMDFHEQDLASDERVNAFARLRFDDGSYYMHTYQIILGRNLALARKDMRRLAKVDHLERTGDLAAAHALLHGKKKKKRNGRGAPSVISEKGGIVSARIESMPLEYQQRRHPSQSASSGSHQNGEPTEEKPAERAPQDVIMQAFPERPDQFDGHIPEDPNDCPLVPIHPEHVTARTGNSGPKGISRRHAKIFYNFEEGAFCIEVLGNNGLHHEGQFCPQGEVVPLEHGDNLSIGAVNIQFFLPDVALTEQQRQRQESGSRPMSFSFENGNGEMESDEEMSSDSEGQMSINPRQVYYHPVDSDLDSEDDANDDDMDDYEEPAPKQKIKIKLKAPRPREPSPPPKKSKKQRALEKKRKREREREREREEDDHSPYESPVKKVKKIRPPQEEPVRASPTKDSKAIKEVKAKEAKDKDMERAKEAKEFKEPKEPKDKGKAPAKAPSKTPAPDEATPDTIKKETPIKDKPEPVKSVPTDSPPLLRKPLEAEIEAGGEIEGLITEEMARQHNLPASLVGHVVEKRKGPGRPPKDGIMSKRQRSQLIKQAKEIERAKAAGIDPADIPAPSIKPKITKRKDSNAGDADGDNVLESTEHGDGTMLGDKGKQKQPMKPPRTPSPEMRIEDYTEEQLQRPSANYVVLIHEAISSSPNGQMNLQQIYNYIEKKYPWYKFKTTTSGWQSSVRHNLGQHDAFVKGDKEGKGFNWRINPEVSIEKERRKRQVSPPVNHAQRPQYYPPPNGYPQYPPQPGYPYHPGMPPPGMPPAPPRLPPSMVASAPRLPPSMARDANVATPAAPQGAPPPSPYASPWAGGNTAGSPSAPMPPRPYPQPPHGTPPVSSAVAGSSGQYGVLYPTSAPPTHNGHSTASPYGGPYANAGASPYGNAPGRPYAPYPPQGYPQPGPAGPPSQGAAATGPPSQSPGPAQSQPASQAQQNQAPPANPAPPTVNLTPEVLARYPANTHHEVIRNLEAFRSVYVKQRTEPGEATKVDNAIRAFIDTTVSQASLAEGERQLLTAIMSIPSLTAYRANPIAVNQGNAATQIPVSSTAAAGTAAAIAAGGGGGTTPGTSSTQPQQVPQASTSSPAPAPSAGHAPATPGPATSEPHRFTPNMTIASTSAPPPAPPAHAAPLPPSHRPSVEPLTPVPGSPAVSNGTPLVKRPMTEVNATDLASNEGEQKPEDEASVSKAE